MSFLIFLMSLGAIVLVLYLLQAVPTDAVRQGFEGFGVAICAVACGGILLWRVIYSFAIEQNIQGQPPAANPAPVLTSEPDLTELRKVKSSPPLSAASVPAAPVASFPRETMRC